MEQRRNMQQDWKPYNSQLPKLSKAKTDHPKAKSLPKSKKAKIKSKKEVPFENIEFVTPPLTPQPTLPEPVVPDNVDFKKDDEFWEFYDKDS